MILTVKDVHKNFGVFSALNGVSLNVNEDLITGLIGPNGSGKTTLFNVISGFYRKDKGSIKFRGEEISGLDPNEIAQKGLVRSFQIPKIPDKMTVLENMLLASKTLVGERVLDTVFKVKAIKRTEYSALKKAFSLLELTGLKELSNEYATNLSGGQKKLLSLGRILMSDPDLILLDEPTAGVNPTLSKELLNVIKTLSKKEKKSFLIIEHNMAAVSEICDKVIVLASGKKLTEGTPEEVQNDEGVLDAYLSREDSESSEP